MNKVFAHREHPIPSLRAARSEVPESLEFIFKKLVAKQASHRYQTASELITDLERYALAPSSSQNAALCLPENIPEDPTLLSATTGSGRGTRRLVFVAMALLGFAILTGVIVSLKTADGTLIVEVNQPNAVIQVSDAEGKIEVTRQGGQTPVSISVDPGQHRLKVEKDGFVVFGRDFEIAAGKQQTITAKLLPLTPPAPAAVSSPVTDLKAPVTFEQWLKEVPFLPAESQVEAVRKKLVELNPDFDGKVTPMIEGGIVTEFRFYSDNITDISPVQAFRGLKLLACRGSEAGRGRLSDLSPLKGLQLTSLRCFETRVADLSPLRGMPLTDLNCAGTPVSDLTPLKGMKLTKLICYRTQVTNLAPLQGMPITELWCGENNLADLSPIKGMPLTKLLCNSTRVTDLSPVQGMRLKSLGCEFTAISDFTPLQGMDLAELYFSPGNITTGINVLRDMQSLQTIGYDYDKVSSAAEFWKKYDAGDFNRRVSLINP
ncbi:PEGA domain-containing protein [Planctomicrobium piriforme]|uniref:PEGA domain-containing protein n=1 Tax=Planctomicrobium piriforme TaxID=1576369 RepID=A0A1I3QIZ0_9PLAN|nr:PEGA domain-containing protein [Planctomicrobium piriforme]SFJ33247.1 PEGA domain-containing protein [Planctomicrobium piriforme]